MGPKVKYERFAVHSVSVFQRFLVQPRHNLPLIVAKERLSRGTTMADAQPRSGLKRSKSLKNLFSRAHKAPTAQDEELLPCRYVALSALEYTALCDIAHAT